MRAGQASRYADRIERALRHLEAGIAAGAPPSLGQLAQVAALSEYHFHRIFRLMTGETVGEATTRLRLAGSLPALEHAGIRQAADSSGYATSQAYGRALRATAGVTPGELQHDPDRLQAVAQALARPGQEAAALRIEVAQLQPLRLLAIRNLGDYADLDRAYTRLFETVCAQLDPAQVRGIYGVPLDDPRCVPPASCRFECALDTGTLGEAIDGLHELRLAGGPHARLHHRGDYDLLHGQIDALYAWAIAHDAPISQAPLFVHYLDDPEQVATDELRAEAWLPLDPQAA